MNTETTHINSAGFKTVSNEWLKECCKSRYTYRFSWLGIPIIQLPQDLVAMQELIWKIRPDVIVETGIAHGGSLLFYSSMLELLGNNGSVVGIDIDIREHNRVAIESHPQYKRITMIEGSSVDEAIVSQAKNLCEGKKVLVCLDSNHTHEHVLRELNLYGPLVSKDSYLVVFDTAIEDMPDSFFTKRPWRKTDNPKTAIHEFLKTSNRFVVDNEITDRLVLTGNPDGYLKCISD